MIDVRALEAAISVALDCLDRDSKLAWIKKSTLVERAYLWGLFNGLHAIADEGAISNNLKFRHAQTAFEKAADDTFPRTQIGRRFAVLEQEFSRLCEIGIFDSAAIEAYASDVDELD